MARFRGTLRGNRGEASRLGHSGLHVTANGWNGGISVAALRDGDTDVFTVRTTGGSNRVGNGHHVGTLRVSLDGEAFWHPACVN